MLKHGEHNSWYCEKCGGYFGHGELCDCKPSPITSTPEQEDIPPVEIDEAE